MENLNPLGPLNAWWLPNQANHLIQYASQNNATQVCEDYIVTRLTHVDSMLKQIVSTGIDAHTSQNCL